MPLLVAVAVLAHAADPALRRLRNVVEEIAIASGVPVPGLYVLPRGALDRLNRDELQGVVAHDLSHIVNGDMRLNIRLQIHPRSTARPGRGRDDRRIRGYRHRPDQQGGVSRQREFLADASAVRFTRQTEGLAGALTKIGGLPTASRLQTGKAEDVSHMLFGEGGKFSALFATHPRRSP